MIMTREKLEELTSLVLFPKYITSNILGIEESLEPKNLYDPGSPTASDMEPPPTIPCQKIRTDPGLEVIKSNNEYTSNLKALEVLWYLPKDALKRKWYTSTYSKDQQKEFGRLWIVGMKSL